MHALYGILVWLALSKDIERAQKRCLRIIFPQLSYSEALDKSGLNRLDTRREEITKHIIFRQIKSYSPTALLNPTPKSFQFSDDIKTYVPLSNPKVQEN